MYKKELLDKGLVPEFITVEQAAKTIGRPISSIFTLIENKWVQVQKLNTGVYVVNTLSLLEHEKGFDVHFSKEQKQRRIKYLKILKIIEG